MSKAFTREDDEAGFELASRPAVVRGPVTGRGTRVAADKLKELSARLEREVDPSARAVLEMGRARVAAIVAAPVAARPTDESVVSFGAQVRFRDDSGRERILFLSSADEIGLVPHAASVTSPAARALLGARKGDVVELEGPSGSESLLVLDVLFPE